ncbi:MAG: 1-acyl-sn-glycerol-3-phosphate acyltransferase [Desulfobacterales bacterium]|nr:1-acyl-sn-glycerol-3-phosphate acyltransferase [Desulfobacterales bacterium]
MLKKGKRLFTRIISNAVNNVDFVNLINKIAHSKTGTPHLERYRSLPKDWTNTEEISALAVDLTMDQLTGEKAPVERGELEDLIKEIEIRYDRDLHIRAAAAVRVMFDHLFDHENPELPFTSPDGRELEHVETLRQYREQGLGVLYLINHNSHLDEFIFNSLMQDLGLGLPVFAAGQNMMAIESIAKVLMTGSYVVLRKGASRHQMAALYNYCRSLSIQGAQQGIFLEAWRGGARTRDGSLRYPKRLVAVRGAIDTDRDLVIQPVALSYSVVPEDLMMCARKNGKTWINGINMFKTLTDIPFHPKSFAWRALKGIYSRCYVSFPEPMLLSRLQTDWQKDKRGTELDEFVTLNAITQIARKKKIMASQLTARAITGAKKNKLTDLEKSLKDQAKTIKIYHRQTFGHAPDFENFINTNEPDAIIKDGISILKKRGILSRWSKDNLGFPAITNDIGLSYYATHGDRRLYSPTADQNIVVVGAGNWGFALANLVSKRLLENKAYDNASITIYDPRKKLVRHMGKERLGPGRFKDKRLRKNIFVTHDLASAFRKASEVIVAVKPEVFEPTMREIISISEQHLKIIIATRGFIPGTPLLPFHMVQNLLVEYQRTDMDVLTLAGPIETDDLVESGTITGIIAGPGHLPEEMAGLILGPDRNAVLSTDPIGVQAADILARVYALCVNTMVSCTEGKRGFMMGTLFARASDEARTLTMAMGASPATFTAGSIPWTATFVTLATDGPLKDLGEKLGHAVKKGKDPARILNKLSAKWRQNGKKIQLISDMEAILTSADQREVEMPLLREAYGVIVNK